MTFSASWRADWARVVAVSGVPVVLVGLLMALFAFVKMSWPPDQPPATRYGVSVSFFERLRGVQVGVPQDAPAALSGKDARWQTRRVWDGLALVMLVAGLWGLPALLWRGAPSALGTLVAVGSLGLVYTLTVGLSTAAVVAAYGFGLVLFGAVLSWLGLSAVGLTAHGHAGKEARTGSDER
jgi:hypothetical protein